MQTCFCKIVGSFLVIFLPVFVGFAVKFDDQFAFCDIKVRNISTDRMLPAKLESAKHSAANA